MTDGPQSGQRTGAAEKTSEGFSQEERGAMKLRARELRTSRRRSAGPDRAEGEREVLEKIAEMPEADRVLAERLHAIIMSSGPDLWPRTWYGMPAYARGGNIVCHYQAAYKFKTRYAMLGFSDKANLDQGTMWPVYYALTELTPANEKKIAALVKQAVS